MDAARDRLDALLVRGRAQRALDERDVAVLCTEAIATAVEVEDARAAAEALVALSTEYMPFDRHEAAGRAAAAALASRRGRPGSVPVRWGFRRCSRTWSARSSGV